MIPNINPSSQIVVVSGRICSGKSTICRQLVDLGYVHISVSDIVRKIVKSVRREDLQNSKNLDKTIAQVLYKEVAEHLHPLNHKVLIDGVRQISVLDDVIANISDLNIEHIWIETSAETRKQRYLARADQKDNQSFEQAEQADDNLGISEFEMWLKSSQNVTIINGE